jgi:hypothetical protein
MEIATDRVLSLQESPHEHQQNLLLSRIITNVVRAFTMSSYVPAANADPIGEAE